MDALSDVDIHLAGGDFVAVMGPSGCGKSTLLNIVAGLITSDSGDVTIADQSVTAMGDGERTRFRLHQIGVVFQDHNLIDDFTVLENVVLPLHVRGWNATDAKAEALRCLELMEVDGFASRRPGQLSGGQEQRVGIARALAGGRPLIVADEPTGALDSALTQSLFQTLSDITNQGVSVLVATHDIAVADYATRVVRLRDGRTVS